MNKYDFRVDMKSDYSELERDDREMDCLDESPKLRHSKKMSGSGYREKDNKPRRGGIRD